MADKVRIKGDPQWAMRRRAVNLVLYACAACVGFAACAGVEMMAVVMPNIKDIVIFTMGFYVTGATAERIFGVPGGNTVEPSP